VIIILYEAMDTISLDDPSITLHRAR